MPNAQPFNRGWCHKDQSWVGDILKPILPNAKSCLVFVVWMKGLDTEAPSEQGWCFPLCLTPLLSTLRQGSPVPHWLLSPCRACSRGAFAHPVEGEGERFEGLSWLAVPGSRLLGALEGYSPRKAVPSCAVFHGRHWPGHREMTTEKPCSFAAIPNHQQKVSSEDWVTSLRCDCKGCLFQKSWCFLSTSPFESAFPLDVTLGAGVTQINRVQLQNYIIST